MQAGATGHQRGAGTRNCCKTPVRVPSRAHDPTGDTSVWCVGSTSLRHDLGGGERLRKPEWVRQRHGPTCASWRAAAQPRPLCVFECRHMRPHASGGAFAPRRRSPGVVPPRTGVSLAAAPPGLVADGLLHRLKDAVEVGANPVWCTMCSSHLSRAAGRCCNAPLGDAAAPLGDAAAAPCAPSSTSTRLATPCRAAHTLHALPPVWRAAG